MSPKPLISIGLAEADIGQLNGEFIRSEFEHSADGKAADAVGFIRQFQHYRVVSNDLRPVSLYAPQAQPALERDLENSVDIAALEVGNR